MSSTKTPYLLSGFILSLRIEELSTVLTLVNEQLRDPCLVTIHYITGNYTVRVPAAKASCSLYPCLHYGMKVVHMFVSAVVEIYKLFQCIMDV
eukprot:692165-Hanusia_phi.AAC.2